MNAHVAFDTLAFSKKLQAAGMEPRLAEALADALNDGVLDTVATKSDLIELELRLTNSLTVRLGAMIGGSLALTIAILGALISFH